MAFSTFDAFVVAYPSTTKPVRSAAGLVTDTDTGEPVQVYDMNGVPVDLIATNNFGLCPGFMTDAAHRAVHATFEGVTLRKVALEVTEAAEGAADSAAASRADAQTAAAQAAALAGEMDTRLDNVEALVGAPNGIALDPNDPTIILLSTTQDGMVSEDPTDPTVAVITF